MAAEIAITFCRVCGEEIAKHIVCKNATVGTFNNILQQHHYVILYDLQYTREDEEGVLIVLDSSDVGRRVFCEDDKETAQTWYVVVPYVHESGVPAGFAKKRRRDVSPLSERMKDFEDL